MSKRLRASIRANNKGRTLRPRTAQTRTSSPSLPPSDTERFSSEPPEASDSQNDALEAGADAETDSADDLRDRETVREPTTMPPPAAAPEPEEKPAAVAAPAPAEAPRAPSPEKVVTAVTTQAKEAAPEKPAAAAEKPAVAAEKPVAAAEKPAAAAEKPVAAAEKPVAAAEKPAAAAEKPVAVAKDKPAAKEPAIADKPATSEKPATSQPAAKSAKAEVPASKKKVAKGAEPARADAAKPAAKRPADEEIDTSSVSAQFFRREAEDSVPPVIDSHEVEDLAPVVPPLSPAVLARRARLRRVVAGVVAFAGVISIAVVGKMLTSSKPTASTLKPPVVVQQENAHKDPQPALEPAPTAQKVAEALKPTTEPAKAVDSADPQAAGSADPKAADTAAPKAADSADAKAAEAKAEDAKKPEPSGDAEALRKETLSLLNRGRTKDAIPKAREAIAADPTDATGYLYLGSALQDSGKWKDGIEAYCDCVRNATKGPISECRQMGGHK